MLLKQISVFIGNEPGGLLRVTKLLKENDIDMRALFIADRKDNGVLRLIVNKPDAAYEILKAADCAVKKTEVVAIGVKDEPGGLAAALECLYSANISVEYLYVFVSNPKDTAYVIMRVENNDEAIRVLNEKGFASLEPQEVYDM